MTVREHLHGYSRSAVKQLLAQAIGSTITNAEGKSCKVIRAYRISSTTVEYIVEEL